MIKSLFPSICRNYLPLSKIKKNGILKPEKLLSDIWILMIPYIKYQVFLEESKFGSINLNLFVDSLLYSVKTQLINKVVL
jgi:hypothetical protein